MTNDKYLMKECLRHIIILLFTLLISTQVFASYISLNTSVTTKVEDNRLKVLVAVTNKGDESAHNVQAEIRVGAKTIMAEKVQELGIDKTYKGMADVSLAGNRPGQYPLVVIMHYADANMYPFSAPTAQTFSYRSEELPSDLFGKIKSVTFWKKGELTSTIKNLGEQEIVGTAKLVIPRELSAGQTEQPIKVSAKGEDGATFQLENFSALSGSTYQIFLVNEYELDNIHRTNITSGQVKIVEASQVMGINTQLLLVALAVLLTVFILVQFGGSIFKK
ncbi:MAG: hypothetical protein ABIE84_05890 [bacterium]